MTSSKKKEIPIPPCNNTNRRTYKCRRMCCARKETRVIEEDAPGKQMQLGAGNYPMKIGWTYYPGHEETS